ncbi:phage tail tape measure protein [Paenibacillus larvae]|nr:phage tail tape measure protein [Paenibacillus larvae]MDT2263959.1 phage tail tape measure protein [Paenibacillus larvae]
MLLDMKDFFAENGTCAKRNERYERKVEENEGPIEKMAGGATVKRKRLWSADFVAVVKGAAADFEQQMSKVKAISGATGDDFQRLNETARHLGAVTKLRNTSWGRDEHSALAGWKTNDIISAMPGMLDLAAAGALGISRLCCGYRVRYHAGVRARCEYGNTWGS